MTALDRHRALLAKALNKGPWKIRICDGEFTIGIPIVGWGHYYSICEGSADSATGKANGKLIVEAVTAHPLLLDLWAAAKECSEAVSDRSGGPIDRMRDILAKLEAMP